ncbi:hypothetical protein FJTKL_07373 [Diaporthe vaccinii]|uniref:DUF7923 domain-containing protein n=1 Tax=Diaporthe vaccinii TaxID=105482 RepID=A0ABR4DQ69_9PEZI
MRSKTAGEWKHRQRRRPFVVALIDADTDDYVFLDNFIKDGAKGGEAAADALLAALQQYVREVTTEPDEVASSSPLLLVGSAVLGPIVLLPDLVLLLSQEVVGDVERLTDLLWSLAFDYIRNV